MRLFSAAIALALCATACVGGDVSEVDGGDDVAPPGTPALDDGHASISSSLETPDDEYNVCEHLPGEPPCSLICDRDALIEYVPESSCVVFVCTLTDGREVSVHACHPSS